jgi:vesicle coat complex subunit
MELENASIAAELSSSVLNNQINALLVLLRLYSAGKDIQNYVSIVIQSVLVKSNDPLVRKLCYQMVKCCTITNKYDWDFLLKEIVRDISNQQNNDLCVWALRSAVTICGTGAKFQEFFIKNQRQIEVCITFIVLLD